MIKTFIDPFFTESESKELKKHAEKFSKKIQDRNLAIIEYESSVGLYKKLKESPLKDGETDQEREKQLKKLYDDAQKYRTHLLAVEKTLFVLKSQAESIETRAFSRYTEQKDNAVILKDCFEIIQAFEPDDVKKLDTDIQKITPVLKFSYSLGYVVVGSYLNYFSEIKDNESGFKVLKAVYDRTLDFYPNGFSSKDLKSKLCIFSKDFFSALENNESQELILPKISASSLPSIITQISKKFDFPLDKANRQFWSLMENTDGQWKIATDTLAKKDKKKGKDSLILINVDMSRLDDINVKLSKDITTYDKWVYMAVDTLYRTNDSHTMTVTNIYKQMGNDKSPNSSDVKKIMDSLTKMSNTNLFLNNDTERELYPNYPIIRYSGKLLEARFISVEIKGTPINGAIQILAELPLMRLARDRKQITTIERKLLAAPVSKTSENMDIMDLLLDRIATAKAGNLSCKILYSYIYEHAKIKTKKQKQRLPGKVIKILDYYKECGHIKGYKKESDGISILF